MTSLGRVGGNHMESPGGINYMESPGGAAGRVPGSPLPGRCWKIYDYGVFLGKIVLKNSYNGDVFWGEIKRSFDKDCRWWNQR